MQTKLTLRLEDSLINQAKNYAKNHNKSVSQIVADYFKLLVQEPNNTTTSPITQSLIGIIEHSNLDEKDYKRHLEEKHL